MLEQVESSPFCVEEGVTTAYKISFHITKGLPSKGLRVQISP